MSFAIDRMLERFTVLYGPPQTDNPEAFVDEYREALRGYRDEIITRTATVLIREQEKPFWPTPGLCLKVAKKVAAEIETFRRYDVNYAVTADGALKLVHDAPRQTPADVEMGIARQRQIAREEAVQIEAKPLPDVSRTSFERIQDESDNTFHRLSEVSRRMTGDRE